MGNTERTVDQMRDIRVGATHVSPLRENHSALVSLDIPLLVSLNAGDRVGALDPRLGNLIGGIPVNWGSAAIIMNQNVLGLRIQITTLGVIQLAHGLIYQAVELGVVELAVVLR